LLADSSAEVRSTAKLASDLISAKKTLGSIESIPEGQTTLDDSGSDSVELFTPPVKRVTFVAVNETDSLNDALEPKSIMKSQGARQRRLTIEKFMPPKTKEDTELFLRCLGEMVAAGTLERFSSRRNFLLDSILAGAELIPHYERWEFVVLSLLDSFKELLFLVLHQLFKLFDFNPLLIACTCQAFTFCTLIDRLRKLPRQQQGLCLRFVVVAIETGIDFVPTDEQRSYILELASNCAEAHELIEDYLQLLANPAPALIRKIVTEKDCDFEFRLLVASPKSTSSLEPAFLRFLATGSAWQKQIVVYIVSNFPAGTFQTLPDAVLSLEGEEHESATAPLLQLFNIDSFFDDFLRRLKSANLGERKCSAGLSFILRYIQTC
jgi:hypothetical protein